MPHDHLSREELCALLDEALALLSPSARQALLRRRAPPAGPPRDTALNEAVTAAEAVVAHLEDNPEAVLAWIGDDWSQDQGFLSDLGALEQELDDALARAGAWLATQAPSEALADRLDDTLEQIDALLDWDCDAYGEVSYTDMSEPPRHLEALRARAYLVDSEGLEASVIAARIATDWPRPLGPSPFGGLLSDRAKALRGALGVLADAGDPGAARWLLLEPGDAFLIDRYAPLADDLGTRWAGALAEAGAWDRLADGLARGIAVPEPLLFHARMQLGRHEEAFRGALEPTSRVDLVEAWDEAMRVGELDRLRSLAAGSSRREARWVGLEEPRLLDLPAKYDHEATKRVVAYAVARATGEPSARLTTYEPGEALLARLATAPGPHDARACLRAALEGLERMIAFHVAARSRSRYARAAAYWAEHAALARRFGQEARHRGLEERFAQELRRLPALRDELGRA